MYLRIIPSYHETTDDVLSFWEDPDVLEVTGKTVLPCPYTFINGVSTLQRSGFIDNELSFWEDPDVLEVTGKTFFPCPYTFINGVSTLERSGLIDGDSKENTEVKKPDNPSCDVKKIVTGDNKEDIEVKKPDNPSCDIKKTDNSNENVVSLKINGRSKWSNLDCTYEMIVGAADFPEFILHDAHEFSCPSDVRRSMINLSNRQLESKLEAYVVDEKDLFNSGFPELDEKNPGCARVYVRKFDDYKKLLPQMSDFTLSEEGIQMRKCARCAQLFPMDATNGDYLNNSEPCLVHPGKFFQGVWQCCGRPGYEQEFCTEYPIHVWTGFTEGVNELVPGYVGTVQFGDLALEDSRYGVYALDCEMAFTKRGMEVIKISVVRMNGTVKYDQYVLPSDEIVDYGSEIHGITARELSTAKKTLTDVHHDLRKFIHAETLLVGHGVFNDLRILRFVHKRVIDSSIIFKHHNGPNLTYSLKTLTKLILNKEIRAPGECHDSIQDAQLAMEIVLRKLQIDIDDRNKMCKLNGS